MFALSFTTWTGAIRRGLCMPEDRLAAALPSSSRVRRLLVSNPYRSLPVVLARSAFRQREEPYAESADVRLHQPLRLRRFDPSDAGAIERTARSYERSVWRAARRLGLEQPAVITTHPLLAGFGRFEWARAVTYYGWDDFAAWEPHRRWWPAYAEAFEPHPRERPPGGRGVRHRSEPNLSYRALNGRSQRDRGVRMAATRAGSRLGFSLPEPRLLYVGTLDTRLDVDQVREVARAYQHGSVSLVGPVRESDPLDALAGEPNVHVFPPVDRPDLPGLVAAADVCLVPHVRTPLTEAMSPLKLYEYLAAGRPVAAVDLPPILGVSDRVALATAGSSSFRRSRRRSRSARPPRMTGSPSSSRTTGNGASS